MSQPQVLIQDLKKTFVREDGVEIAALDGINLQVEKGEFLCLLGPTGCGKTTLLRMIAGLENMTEGVIQTPGTSVDDMGFVFQQYSLFPWRNVLDNIAFGLEVRGIPKRIRHKKAESLIALLGLEGFAHSYPHELSGGMQQRVAISRSIATNTQILLMDEPFGALDEQTRRRLQKELVNVCKSENKTVLFVTHNIEEAVYLADRIVVIGHRPGRIIKIVEVPLCRPRQRTSPHFVETYLKVREVFQSIFKET